MTVREWFFKPAAPWQFWLPQSGPIGGVIMGFAVYSILVLLGIQ